MARLKKEPSGRQHTVGLVEAMDGEDGQEDHLSLFGHLWILVLATGNLRAVACYPHQHPLRCTSMAPADVRLRGNKTKPHFLCQVSIPATPIKKLKWNNHVTLGWHGDCQSANGGQADSKVEWWASGVVLWDWGI